MTNAGIYFVLLEYAMPSGGATQVNRCIDKALWVFNSSLQVTARSISGTLFVLAGIKMCSAFCAICFSLRQREGNCSSALCLSTKYLRLCVFLQSRLVCFTFSAQIWMNLSVFYAYRTIYLQIMPDVKSTWWFLDTFSQKLRFLYLWYLLYVWPCACLLY